MSYTLIQQVRSIRDEFDVAKSTVDYLERSWLILHGEPAFQSLQRAQVRQAAANLEATYIVRLFSAFEAILRDAIPGNQPDRRSAYSLINKAASKWHICADLRAKVDIIREFRNRYVHQAMADSSEMTFVDALATLSRSLNWLPDPY